MDNKVLEIIIYGAEQICASCVGAPSSLATVEWLDAAISRKYPEQPFRLTYVDIFNPPNDLDKEAFSKRVIEEDLFYPVVVIEGEIVGEGSPRLKTIFSEMEKYGYRENA